ncbi:PREDICTED: fucose mutarotase [Galeopterus variegatus]|uniref:L-fucose mutarotase n=1 Tax=Galeopterus variegatus TaxID=482537 RepID=A0ABM0S9J1_GALVR|nr:PREDICTED: fucose mutarotase [Galeopterus variegatus]
MSTVLPGREQTPRQHLSGGVGISSQNHPEQGKQGVVGGPGSEGAWRLGLPALLGRLGQAHGCPPCSGQRQGTQLKDCVCAAHPETSGTRVNAVDRQWGGGGGWHRAGLGIPQLLEAVLQLLPLDTYLENPAAVMELVPSAQERGLQSPVWKQYGSSLSCTGCTMSIHALAKIERFEFYKRAKKAFAVVASGETALYGNLIFKKGVLALGSLQ